MPRIATFVYSEGSAHQGENKEKLFLENPQYLFQSEFIPSLFSFSVSFGIADLDNSKENELRFIFSDPQEETLIESDLISLPTGFDEDLPPELRGFMFNMNFRNVRFEHEGYYCSEIFINGESVGKFPIYVIKRG